VPGQVVLLGGDPHRQVHTLLLQTLATLKEVLYVTGEESAEQIAMRARRLSLDAGGVRLLAETQLERILGALDAGKPAVAVIDSIQTLWSETAAVGAGLGGAGARVRGAADAAREARRDRALHSSAMSPRKGAIAGPRVLEHIVDTVLYFEGDPHSSFRLIRAVKKPLRRGQRAWRVRDDRQGPARRDQSLGAVPLAASARRARLVRSRHGGGTRPLLVEIQALVDAAHARRTRAGFRWGSSRTASRCCLAVLHRHAGIATWEQDVFVNAVGGVRIGEPAADLAVSLAVVSSLSDRAIPEKVVVFGEIGLAGEVRPAPRGPGPAQGSGEARLRESDRAARHQPKAKISGLESWRSSGWTRRFSYCADL